MLFKDKLYFAPLETVKLDHVLDIATGTGMENQSKHQLRDNLLRLFYQGIWAIEFAETNTETTVIGSDLSPIQPT